MRVTMLTPLPPEKTGVAHYASMLIPELRKRVELDVISSPESWVLSPESRNSGPRTQDSALLYQLGNNPYHEWVYLEAMRTPGIIVLHEIVMHHLIVEMTLARGDVEGYVAAMEANHGAPGAAWARGRAAGLHSEMGNFLLPASVEVARRSRGVIVHNEYAAERLRSFGVTTPIHVVAHPFEPHPEAAAKRGEVRARLGFADGDRVIGFLGYVTAAKRPHVVVDAFSRARAADPRLRMLVVGDPAPNIDLGLFARDGITFTGYAPDEEFPAYIAAVDQIVNLRYPSAGEASGILMRALEAGKPVAVSDYGPFAEMPDDCVVKIPFDGEIEALTKYFLNTFNMSAAQRRWLEQNATTEIAAEGYLRALEATKGIDVGVSRSIPLFPSVKATRHGNEVTLRNTGDFTLRARTYGQPGYRVIAKWEGGDRWFQLPRDLAPGEEATIALPQRSRLYHALESIPMLDPEPFDEV